MAVSSLVRRGIEAVSDRGELPPVQFQGGFLGGLLVLTVLACFIVLFSVEYTYGMIVPTLAAIESPNPDLFIRVEVPNNKNSPDVNELEAEIVAAQPITSKLRTTIRHLRARAGRWSRFRGLSMVIAMTAAEGIFLSMVPRASSSVVGQFVVNILAAIVLANMRVAWVHIVISEPSPKRFYQRLPGLKAWKKILPAAAFECALVNIPPLLVVGIAKLFHGLDALEHLGDGKGNQTKAIQTALNIASIAALASGLASIPAKAIFIRVAASLLPEEDEAIVPFDRTFGGKVVPAIVGGSGVLSISDAWKTFDKGSFKRYLKAIGKAVAIELAVVILFSLAITAEILGGAISLSKEKGN